MSDYRRPGARLHLNAFFPFGPIYVWDEVDRPQRYYEFDGFTQLAQTAERGLFTAVFLGDSQRLREHLGRITDTAVTGRPDQLVLFAHLAALTRRIGLVATFNTTYSDPVEFARRIATLDVLSQGRAGWNLVTTHNAWTGENFRRGGYLDHGQRYRHALEYLQIAQQLWSGERVQFKGEFYDLAAEPSIARSPQGSRCCSRPVSPTRVASSPPVTPRPSSPATWSSTPPWPSPTTWLPGSERSAGPGRRSASSRPPGSCWVTPPKKRRRRPPGSSAAPGPTAGPSPRWRASGAPTCPATTWTAPTRDRPGHPRADRDPRRGQQPRPAPAHRPTLARTGLRQGWSIRQLVAHLNRSLDFVGTPSQVADRLAHYVRAGAIDGLNLVANGVPTGYDDVVDHLVPALQERGAYPTDYAGPTLRENLSSGTALAPTP